jgi:hypothetical protein
MLGTMRRVLLSFIIAATIASPAQADVLGDVGQHLGQVGSRLNQVGAQVSRTLDENIGALWGFLGSSQPETGLLMPVEVTPAVRLPESVKERPTGQARLILAELHLPYIPPARELPKPSFEKGSKFLYCVEYARALSGLNIFGDAKHWWAKAKDLYARVAHPAESAVMVFSGSSRLKRGHLAVVSHIVSPREIRVEQANWLNRGEIDRSTPVLDVSEKNDWSKVRVWDVPSGQYGSRTYAISGFILQPEQRLARND